MESRRVKSAGGGKKLFPNKPLPSNKSPWQKKQCWVYKMPPFLMFSLEASLKGFFKPLSATSLPLRRNVLGTSSEGGGGNPQAGEVIAITQIINR
jgi:hypothetical protein